MTTPKIVTLTIPTPLPVGPVNAYLIEGDPLTLIDAGPKDETAWRTLQSTVRAAGYRLADIQRIVLTHTHIDHFGLLRRVVAECGAPVFAHPRSIPWLTHTATEWEHRIDYFVEFWARCGVPTEKLDLMRQVFVLAQYFTEPLDPDDVIVTINEGSTLTLGGVEWTVMYTPGHAGNHICLYDPVSCQMISGDLLLLKVSSNPMLEPPTGTGPRTRSLVEYMASMRRVAALDVSVAWPGHGEPITNHRALIEQRLKHHAERCEYIAGLLSAGPHSVYELTAQMFPRLPDAQLFLGVSEVIGHLDVLEAEGRVREICLSQPVHRYERVG